MTTGKGEGDGLTQHVKVEGYDIVLNCVYVPMLAVLNTELNFVFLPGMPRLFHENYSIAKPFFAHVSENGT